MAQNLEKQQTNATAFNSPNELQERVHDNLKRMGCYMILSAYMDLKRWIKPYDKYTNEQIHLMNKEDPIQEIEEFFFGPDGVEDIIKVFQINLNTSKVRILAKSLIEQARLCMQGEEINTDTSTQEAWDVLTDTLNRTEKG